jgi:hypothetical protein
VQADTPKREMLARLGKIVEGLRDRGYAEDAERLASVCAALKQRISKDATIQEVNVRTLGECVRREITLDGRLVDVLGYLAKTHGISLAMHPVLLLIVALGGRDNPDRADPEYSERLDALLSTMLEERIEYQRALYTIATLARQHGLDSTADMAVELLEEIHERGASSMETQASTIEETRLTEAPDAGGDDLAWVIKLMLTLASLTMVAAVAVRLAGSVNDLIGALDSVVGLSGGDPS